jgi:hypothetical protein
MSRTSSSISNAQSYRHAGQEGLAKLQVVTCTSSAGGTAATRRRGADAEGGPQHTSARLRRQNTVHLHAVLTKGRVVVDTRVAVASVALGEHVQGPEGLALRTANGQPRRGQRVRQGQPHERTATSGRRPAGRAPGRAPRLVCRAAGRAPRWCRRAPPAGRAP